ncbi:MAG: IS1595 family transposase [Hyphomicrobiaceae bacterium]|nr:IS1595 family transposase [Hyphomicrobiaceae bacterium]
MRAITSLYDFFEVFPDEQAAIDHLRAIRWKDGAFCPYCNSKRVMHFSDKKTHKCHDCRQRFSIKVGTIFADTKLPLRKWFATIWLITSHKKGIASTQLAKDLKITQKSAWFVLHRLRHAARTKSFNRPLEGTVELDETLIGGKESNKHKKKRNKLAGGRVGKTVVFGMLERGGELRAKSISNLQTRMVRGRVLDNVKKGARLMTDDAPVYKSLHGMYPVGSVNHSAGEYVKDINCHINTLEGAWSLFKRQVYGIHHHVSAKHLDAYLGEMCYRYNRRAMGEGDRVNDLLGRVEGRLTYKVLTHGKTANQV